MREPEAVRNFFLAVEGAQKDLQFQANEYPLFRGHSSCKFSLLPSLYRATSSRPQGDLWRLESDLFFEFQSRAHQIHGQGLSDWDVLFLMRHHGVPTRLLDWTEVLGVALYFALHNFAGKGQPCVWLLNPWRLNERAWVCMPKKKRRDLVAPKYLGWRAGAGSFSDYGDILAEGEEKMGWELPVVVYPMQTNPRLAAQKGLFTIHGDSHQPLEKQAKDCVRRVDIPIEAIPAIRNLLEVAGTDEYLLFPDLDGLARTLSVKYKLGSSVERAIGRECKK